ncbi:MAG: FAD-dependent oxidoreductase [candidate division WOR-3 bacterium]
MCTIETDVAVIGAGAAGLSAAIAAAEKGVHVSVFEKGKTTGGTGNMGMGLFAVESRHQKLRQMGPSKEDAFRVFMEFTHWRVDALLVRTYIEKSADTIEWLESMGVEFLEPMAYFPGGWPTWHIVKPGGGPGCAANMFKKMTLYAKKLGVQFYFNTPVKRLVKEKDKITGCVAENQDGEIMVKAKAVIIATGGCGNNPHMIKQHTGLEWGKDLFSFRVAGIDGDGIRMAWEIGAKPTKITMQLIYIMPGEVHPQLAEAFRQPHLLVNLKGQRFINEGIIFNSTFVANAIFNQPNKIAYMIFDENIKQHMENVGFDFIHVPFPFFKLNNFEILIENCFKRGIKDVIFICDSIEELAEKTGIDMDGLKEQLEKYNYYCEKGFDPDFNKNTRYLRPIKKPKFYAGKLALGGYGSLGGITINYKCEVVDKDNQLIKGLYAAGTDANTINADTYVFILPGNTMGFAVNSGRIAGENAAEYVKNNSQAVAYPSST